MQNLTQIKSGHQRYTIIEPISRAISYQTLEDKCYRDNPRFHRSPYCESNFNIANIVKEILQIKPKTAGKNMERHSSRNHKTQSIVQSKPSLQFFTNKTNNNTPRRDADNIEEHNQDIISKKLPKWRSKDKKKYNLLEINVPKSKETPKNYDCKSLITKKQLLPNHLQSIQLQSELESQSHFKDTRCKNYRKELEKKLIEGPENGGDKPKNNGDIFIPKNKLSIKNIDKLVDVEPKQSQNRSKKYIRFHVTIQDSETSPNQHLSKQVKQPQSVLKQVKRTKRSVTDLKIPEFIKASLEVYQQQPIYMIPEGRTLSKEPETNEIEERDSQQIVENKTKTLSTVQLPNAQEIIMNKMKLVEKDKRKIVKPLQLIKLKRDEDENHSQAKKVEPRRPFQHRRKYLIDDCEEKPICGWQENDPKIPETLYFNT